MHERKTTYHRYIERTGQRGKDKVREEVKGKIWYERITKNKTRPKTKTKETNKPKIKHIVNKEGIKAGKFDKKYLKIYVWKREEEGREGKKYFLKIREEREREIKKNILKSKWNITDIAPSPSLVTDAPTGNEKWSNNLEKSVHLASGNGWRRFTLRLLYGFVCCRKKG